ncbi:pirin family protein [Virgibacillus oceani]
MLRKLDAGNHTEPPKGYFTIKRIHPGKICKTDTEDFASGPLSNIDHAFMKNGLTIKMHDHVNDEILSYVWEGISYHKDSAGLEDAIKKGRLMFMNAGESFWHEEKAKNEDVEMLQIFVRPCDPHLPPNIQFHGKPLSNDDWYLMADPDGIDAPLTVRQNTYIFDAHPKAGKTLKIPVHEGLKPFLYVMQGEITIGDLTLGKYEAVTDLEQDLPPITATKDATIVLFLVDMNAPMTLDGTISGIQNQ